MARQVVGFGFPYLIVNSQLHIYLRLPNFNSPRPSLRALVSLRTMPMIDESAACRARKFSRVPLLRAIRSIYRAVIDARRKIII